MTSAQPAAPDPEPWLRVRGVGKSYGGVSVLRDIDLDIAPGRVYGLLGENGAGKSTLAKVIAGAVPADHGSIAIDGTTVSMRSPRDALAHGIAVITQELSMVPARTVAENIALGNQPKALRLVRESRDRARVQQLARRVGFALDPGAIAGTLSVAEQQQVEILRVLGWGARLVIMDEPTAALSGPETQKLLSVIRRLADDGTSVILVSHFLEQVLDVADEVIVLRDGNQVHAGPADAETPGSLVRYMVGRTLDVAYPDPPRVPDGAPVVLEASGLARGHAVQGVDLHVRQGEILGLAGLIGAGRTETARLIFGADQADAGDIHIRGERVRITSPRVAMRHGIAMVPEDRKDQGLVLVRPLQENVSLASLADVSTGSVIRGGLESVRTQTAIDETGVRGSDLDGPVWALSGGNQQKVLFAKWVRRTPDVLIVDEPTRGVDVGAKLAIHELLRGLASDGMAIVLISSEVEEVLGLAHRTLVMRRGRVVAELDRDTADPEAVLAAAFAATDPEVARP